MEGLLFLFPMLFMFGIAAVGLLALAFWIWMLVDCLQNEPSEGDTKLIWVLVIILANWIGALIYYFVQRPKRQTAARLVVPPSPRV